MFVIDVGHALLLKERAVKYKERVQRVVQGPLVIPNVDVPRTMSIASKLGDKSFSGMPILRDFYFSFCLLMCLIDFLL